MYLNFYFIWDAQTKINTITIKKYTGLVRVTSKVKTQTEGNNYHTI